MATKSIKEVFEEAENGTLTWEQFQEATKDCKFVNLNDGEYVSKKKYMDELASRDTTIGELNNTISTRDTDLESLKQQLQNAGVDSQKLATLTEDIAKLQGKYDADVKDYKEKLKKQAYEFAVRDFANSKQFTSQAAKRDFIQSMIAKDLKLENNKILGAEDFVVSYSADNADAFVQPKVEEPHQDNKPEFVNPTQGSRPAQSDSNAFLDAFHFSNFIRQPE